MINNLDCYAISKRHPQLARMSFAAFLPGIGKAEVFSDWLRLL
jgi:hypothetical protein